MRLTLNKVEPKKGKTSKYHAIERDIERIYIPTEYYSMRKNQKELFMMTLKRAINKINKESD